MTTSTEFVEWMVFLEKEEWQEHSKQDYYMAQIAAEVRRLSQSFAKDAQPVSTNDALLKFNRVLEDGTVVETKTTTTTEVTISTKGRKDITPSREAMQDPKWRKVCQNAKMSWAWKMGIDIPGVEMEGTDGQ